MLRIPPLMPPVTRVIRFGCFAVLSVLVLRLPASAQQGLSTLRGTVTDKTGAVVVGVGVSARDVSTNIVVRSVTSDSEGNYEMPGLKAGTYQVTGSMSGFKTSV